MSTSSRLLSGGLAAGFAALLAACGSSGSATVSVGGNVTAGGGAFSVPTLPPGIPGIGSSSAGASIDACTALSAGEASQISGGNLVKEAGSNAGGVSECVYADQTTGAGAIAIIESVPGLSGTAALQVALGQASHGGSPNAQPVSGLGDAALKDVQEHAATVAFSKGRTLVVVGVYGSTRDGGSMEPDLEGLAHQIEAQL